MLTENYVGAFVALNLKSVINKQRINGMKNGIIDAVCGTISFACLTHDFDLLEGIVRPFHLFSNDKNPILVTETHSSTCLSCSTFL